MNYFCYLRLKARDIVAYIIYKVNNFLKYFLEYFRNKVKSRFQDGWIRALTLGRAAAPRRALTLGRAPLRG